MPALLDLRVYLNERRPSLRGPLYDVDRQLVISSDSQALFAANIKNKSVHSWTVISSSKPKWNVYMR
ncbi:hypothetical protein V3C99_017238 [Haemonchus contortus]